jgi:hypothetical protein
MLHKTQWSLAASALAVGVLLVIGARPAQAQARIHLTRPVSSAPTTRTGIVIPPSSPQSTGIVIPPSTPQSQTTKPTTINSTPVVTQPTPPVVTPPTTTPRATYTPPAPVVQAAPQGFSVGPGLLGEQRIPLGRVVNRVGPDINGDGFPDVRKDPRSR